MNSTASSNELVSLKNRVHQQINQYRQSLNLPPLELNSQISEQAKIHSENMAQGKIPLGHARFSERVAQIAQTIPYRSAAENVSYNQGFDDPVTQAVEGWLDSSTHRQNITGQYNLTGIGIAKNARGEYYFTQIFILER